MPRGNNVIPNAHFHKVPATAAQSVGACVRVGGPLACMQRLTLPLPFAWHTSQKWQFYVKTWFNQPARKQRRRQGA